MTSEPPPTDPSEPESGEGSTAEGDAARRSSHASRHRHLGVAALVALAVAGAVMMAILTQHGIGLWEDSFDYMTAAKSLAENGSLGRMDGLGAFRPLTHFPPAYPMLLALLETAGLEIYSAARWLNVALFGALIFLSGAALWRVTSSSVWGVVYSALVLSSEVLVGVHLWALTEPLYLVLAVAAILLAASYVAHPRRRALLFFAALLSASALLTRYAGVATVIAVAGGLLLLPGRPRSRRWRDAFWFSGISFLPVLAFLGRNLIVAGAPTDEARIAWHSPLLPEWEEAARTVLNWGLPDVVVERLAGGWSLAFALVGVLLTALVARWVSRALWERWRREGDGGSAVGLLYTAYGIVYLFVFLATVLWLRRILPADNRLLAPLNLVTAALLVAALSLAWRRGSVTGRILVLGACALIAGFQSWRLSGLLEVLPNDSRGFASNAWRASETVEYVRGLPGVPIYSNEIQAIYFLTGRIVSFIPTPVNPATGGRREDYLDALARMRERLRAEEGALVLINPDEISPEEMSDLVQGLYLEAALSDGFVYRPRPPDS